MTQMEPRPQPGPARKIVSYVWALSPIYTLGLATPLTMGIAAARLKSAWHWLALIPYFAFAWIMLATSDSAEGTAEDAVFVVTWLLSSLAGTCHALAVRRRVFEGSAPRNALERARMEAEHRRALRVHAAGIARDSPQMALEMRIGRPDLPRTYDDGGLVDINHAPASALMTIPGMTPEHAERIVALRHDLGGFSSAEEVAAMAELPPGLTPHLAELGVFPR
ncbi:ComEA family DNA-binding protein [Actinomadura rugatobispora]|uniref:ComEA family DNA-binding protein n=1 Tax=Actinomadura rugatobispora TaxID=1994 RepID=A0ABW0ZTG9_9ACTN|nr:hypothetical protein GCM10010200_059620 [Actinomadura rugatobispora]